VEIFMKYDYIIIGAGSAGCVLANRLSQNTNTKVLLIEAGRKNNALSLKIPAAVLENLQSTRHNWAFQGEPEPELGGRRITHDRGKTLGGSSSINGMVFIRGHALDFEGWRQMGCKGWGYYDVLPYFKRMETYSGGKTKYRGGEGPLNVHRPTPENPIYKAFLAAGHEAGYDLTEDICGYQQEGFGVLDMSIHKGERRSTATSYLDPVRNRDNISVITNAHVQKILFNGKTATGVRYIKKNGKTVDVLAKSEVILSAGAVGSPHILMLSGVGPAEHLKQKGLPVVIDLPGVGQNLNDHPDFVLKYRCLQNVSILPHTRFLGRMMAGARWLLRRDGICASNQFEAVACFRSSAGVEYPDIQLTISPIGVDDETWKPLPEHAFQIHVGLMRTYSRGSITLRDADPSSPPAILVNYMKDPRDRDCLRKGIRLVRELVQQPAFSKLCGDEIYPGEDAQTDIELDECLNNKLSTQWHLSGTARMGASNDRDAVVDPCGRVHGLAGLRVVDASIMPFATNGNINSPTIMIAEKLSDAILGKAPLPRVDLPVWQNRNYETCQR
jgi:choline dehydrogenase